MSEALPRSAQNGGRHHAGTAVRDRWNTHHGLSAQPEAFHFWLPLTAEWSDVEYASYSRVQGVPVVASAAFSTDGNPPAAVRVCLGGPLSAQDCEHAVLLIADTLQHPRHPHSTVA